MFFEQQTEAFFDHPNIRVMAKTGFEPDRNSRLLGINLPRMEICDNRLPVALFKNPKDQFRIGKGKNSEIPPAGSRKVNPRNPNRRRGNFRQWPPVTTLVEVSKSRRVGETV